MPGSAVRILVVGPLTTATNEMSQRLERHGWATHAVATLRDAYVVLQTIRFPLVLAAEKLDDGTGYELTSWATKQELTLIVGLPLTETLLWLPVVEAGRRSLGSRALNPIMLEGEIERMFAEMDSARAIEGVRSRELRAATSGPVLREEQGATARRKNTEARTTVPPLRERKAPPPVTTQRAASATGKHWRG
jgi:DNA-binding NtrC family response regulator